MSRRQALALYGALTLGSVPFAAADPTGTLGWYWLVAAPAGLAVILVRGDRKVAGGAVALLGVTFLGGALGGGIVAADAALGATLAVAGQYARRRELLGAGLAMAGLALLIGALTQPDARELVAATTGLSLLAAGALR